MEDDSGETENEIFRLLPQGPKQLPCVRTEILSPVKVIRQQSINSNLDALAIETRY
jgi:hypothetical protein